MIDTISGYLDVIELNIRIDKLDDILRTAKTVPTKNPSYSNLYVNLNNFRFTFNILNQDIGPKVKKVSFSGSVPKFLYENNIAFCTRKDIETCLIAFYDYFGIDFTNAVITRIDFGFNFVVSRPISDYINSINGFPRYKKSYFQNESVTFISSERSILFYDKIKEVKEKSDISLVPDIFHDIKIIRFEVSIKKNVQRAFKTKISYKTLYSIKFQKTLRKLLLEYFRKVTITDINIPSISSVSRKAFLKNFFANIGLMTYGYDKAMGLVENLDYDVKNPNVKISQLKKTLKELASFSGDTNSISLKDELEAKFGVLLSYLY